MTRSKADADAVTVFIAAEGPSEIGDLASASQWRGKPPCEGYFQPMLRKLLGEGVRFEGEKVTVLRRYADKDSGKLDILADRARMALALARTMEGCRVVVFAHDVDREQSTETSAIERRRRVAEMHAKIDAGFAKVRDAQHIERIKATPLRMIEAWALGDPDAVRAVAGERCREPIPSKPEETWGDKRDPASGYPKCVLRRVLQRDCKAQDFAEIARRSRVPQLRAACPVSFAPFADEAAEAAAKLGLSPVASPPSSRPRAARRPRRR